MMPCGLFLGLADLGSYMKNWFEDRFLENCFCVVSECSVGIKDENYVWEVFCLYFFFHFTVMFCYCNVELLCKMRAY